MLKTRESYINNRVKRNDSCPRCNMCPKCKLWRTMGKLCEYCKPKDENKLFQKTKEMEVVKYLKKKLPEYEFIHNKSVGTDCTKGHLFPNIRFKCNGYQLICEVDEFKHRGAKYECDKQRMYDIIAKIGEPCIFIRYNPDGKDSNKDELVKKLKEYLNLEESDYPWDEYGFYSEYMFY